MSVCDHRGGVVGCGCQFSRVPGLDFVAKQRSLAIGNGRKARRGCATLLGSRLDRHLGETRVRQVPADQVLVMVAGRRAGQEARRIVRKDACKRIRHVIGEYVLLDAIPYAEKESSAGLEHALCLAVGGRAVWKEHRAELTADEIEGRV